MPKITKTKEPKQRSATYSAPKKKSDEESNKAPNLSTLTNWLSFAEESARKKHWEWFVIDQFLRGNHNVRGNPQENTIVVQKQREKINFPINKIYTTFRAVRAFVTRHKPKIDVSPSKSTDEARTYARRANNLLERDNSLNNFRRINKEWVYYGIKYGIGWRQVGYDQTKKCAIRWTIDPFDFLIGSKTSKMEDAPYVIKTLVRTVGYWKSKYPKANVSPDNEVAADEYKRLMMEINYQSTTQSTLTTDEQTMIGYECWYRLFEKNKMGGLVNKCLFTETEILQSEETPYTEYPFIPYEAEISPNDTYPDGHLKNVIAPQRMLNLLNTQLLEYNHIVNRGRFLKDKNAGFHSIMAKEGQIIEKNPGKSVQVIPPPPLNPALQGQLDLAQSWIEEIGGSSDASRGMAPFAGASGAAIEKLQIADTNNISDLRDNFEDALAKEASWILKVYSLFEKDGVVLTEEIKNKEVDTFGVVGKEALGGNVPEKYYIEDNGSYCDICAILSDNDVKVSVTSELGETKNARLELLMRLVEMGLPFKTLLEYLEFPNTSDVLERVAEEAVAEMMMEKMAQPQQPGQMPPEGAAPPPTEGAVPPPPPPPSEDIEALIGELEG